MKSALTTALLLFAFATLAQSPPGINYQGVARNSDGKPISLKDITIKINIVKDGEQGEIEYAEVHSVKTNSFGLFTLVIGNGVAQTGDFRFVSWAIGNKWLRVEMDPDGGHAFKTMGAQEFMSVPYAFYAKYAGNSNTNDHDADPANEFNTSFELGPDKKLKITDGGGTKEVDLSGIGNTVVDTDQQQLNLTGNELAISNGNKVDLSSFKDNTDSQNLSSSASGTNRTINISGGNSATIDVADNDNNPANELQDLSLSGNILNLSSDATPVDLSAYKDNTDSQSLTLDPTAHTLKISGGNVVSLASYLDDTDTDQQNLTMGPAVGTNRTINIQRGSSVNFSVADNDNDPANEIQRLAYDGTSKTLSIDGANAVVIPEDQNLSQVLVKGNNAGGQTISNIGAPVTNGDAVNKTYADQIRTDLNTRISTNYAFKAAFNFSAVLGASEVTMPLTDQFDDFNVTNSTSFVAPVAGVYMFILDGSSTGLLLSSTVNLQYAGTKYPTVSATKYNSTFMFKLNAGEVVTVVVTGISLGGNVTGSFYGYKLL